MRSASSASKMRPVNMSSWARATPTTRGSNQLVPMSQADRPMRMNAALKRAERAAIRMSEPSTSARPPPAAGPFTAAITGCGSDRSRGINEAMCFCPSSPDCICPMPSVFGIAPNPPRSRPAQNPRPAPVRITTRQLRSARICSKASWRSATSSTVMAFNLVGRSMVTTATPSAGRVTPTVAGASISNPLSSLGSAGKARRIISSIDS